MQFGKTIVCLVQVVAITGNVTAIITVGMEFVSMTVTQMCLNTISLFVLSVLQMM